MVSEELVMLATRSSATLTTLLGIVVLVFAIMAFRKLLSGEFRNLVISSIIFILIFLAGVTSMTLFHLIEETPYSALNETFDNVWYVLVFIALIFSCVESIHLSRFGKSMDIGKFMKRSNK